MGRGVFLKDQLRSLTQGGEATWFSLLLEPLHAYVRPYSPHNPNARDEALRACICMGSGHHATSPAEHGLSAPEFWDLYSYAQKTWHRTILNLAKCVLRSDMNIRKNIHFDHRVNATEGAPEPPRFWTPNIFQQHCTTYDHATNSGRNK